jgi:hypothetical protein
MNDGFINEKELREYINSNTFCEYNKNIQEFLSFVFKEYMNPDFPFLVEKNAGQVKPDLCIKHNGIIKHISIKMGSGNSVHQEKIDVFFPFIGDMFGEEYINYLKKFHYGDGTINDTGITRYSAKECKKKHAKEIDKLNKKINEWHNLRLFLDRFLFIGNVGFLAADVVYHGAIESGLWASREEIMDYVQHSATSANALHFGPLTYQVWGRDEKRNAVHPNRRYEMQVKWGSISKVLIKIREADE